MISTPKRRFWPFQIPAFNYTRVKHPALFMEMRLGKTLVTIRRILTYRPRQGAWRRVLVVGPNPVLQAWAMELAQEGQSFLYDLRVGNRAQRRAMLDNALQAGGHSWSLLNKEGFLALPEIGDAPWDAVVLDESPFIKNPKAKVTRFYCKHFQSVPHRWILTGTPAVETELDYYQQFYFLDRRFFGAASYWKFRAKNFRPIGYDWTLPPEKRHALADAVGRRAFLLRRNQVGGGQEVPKKVFEQRWLELPPDLLRTYKGMEKYFELIWLGREIKEVKGAGERYAALRHLSNGFVDNQMVWDGKIREILSLATGELAGESLLVWFEYNEAIPHLAAALHRAGITVASITGSSPLTERDKIIDAFQNSKIRVLALQSRCTAWGVDLSRAGAAVFYDGVTSGAIRQQATDRVVHLERSGPALIIDLITRKTVDEDIFHLIHMKRFKSLTLMDMARRIQERRKKEPKQDELIF